MNIARIKALAVVSLFSLVAAGCSTLGHEFDSSKIDALKPGVTTKQEAIDTLGKPYKRQMGTLAENAGKERITWQYAKTNNMTLSSYGEVVAIEFDKEGKMTQILKRGEVSR